MSDDRKSASLKLLVPLLDVRRGETIEARIEAINALETVVTLHAPDTVVISQPHTVAIGSGTFQHAVRWTVEHAQRGTSSFVEITVSDGHIVQRGMCKVVG